MTCLCTALATTHLHVIPDDQALFVPEIRIGFEQMFFLEWFWHLKISLVYLF